MATKAELSTMPYAQLQQMAKDQKLKYVGVGKDDLVDALVAVSMGAVSPETPADEETGEVLGETTEYTPEEFHTQQEIEAQRAQEQAEKDAADGKVPTLTTTKNVSAPDPRKQESIPDVKFKEKLVRIKPKKDIPKSFIGNDVWELKAGKVYEVPVEVAEIFENGGYL